MLLVAFYGLGLHHDRKAMLAGASQELDKMAQGLVSEAGARIATAENGLLHLLEEHPAPAGGGIGSDGTVDIHLLPAIAPWLRAAGVATADAPVAIFGAADPVLRSLLERTNRDRDLAARPDIHVYPTKQGDAWRLAILRQSHTTNSAGARLGMVVDLGVIPALSQARQHTPTMAALVDTADGQVRLAFPRGKQPDANASRAMAQYFIPAPEAAATPIRLRSDYIGATAPLGDTGLTLALAQPKAAFSGALKQRLLRDGLLFGSFCALMAVALTVRGRTRVTDPGDRTLMAQFRAIADISHEAIQLITPDGRVVFANAASHALFGHDAAIGSPVPSAAWVLRTEDDTSWEDAVLPAVINHHGFEGTMRLGDDAAPARIWLRADLVPGDIGGSTLVLCIMHDVTEDARKNRTLRRERDAAERANHAKSNFLASMSHELRTPLNAILGFAQLLDMDTQKKALGEKQREHVGHILASGRHLLSLIDDVLDLSKIEAGTIDIATETALVANLLEDGLATLRPAAERAGVKLTVENDTAPRAGIRVDTDRFQQVFMNLGSNAIKYNREQDPRLTIRAENRDDTVRISFIDTGIGLSEDQLSRLFEPFNRLGREQGQIDGTGIGLTITKRLVELMDGRIGVSSRQGEGSHFWIDLPVAGPILDDLSGAEIVSLRDARTQRAQNGGYTVLYVEDNAASVQLMRALLETLPNVALLTATRAEDGLELAETHQPDVIVMDVGLPGMSGLEAMEHIRRSPQLSHIPVLALSAAAQADDLARGGDAGFVRYLTKPVDMRSLLAALTAALEHPMRRTPERGGPSAG